MINTDWWEPITEDLCSTNSTAQAQVLLALGSEEQIRNLEIDRGFKKDSVKSIFTEKVKRATPNKRVESKVKLLDKTTQICSNNTLKSVDIGIQSDLDNSESSKMQNSLNQECLQTFLTELMSQKQKSQTAEISTNTDEYSQENSRKIVAEETNLQLRKTSELLDSLHKALNYDPDAENSNTEVFKAHVVIENAMHLPVRKKCKSKKSKVKSSKKNEDVLPTTYVVLESVPEENPQVTNAIKGTNPKWDHRCDVILPSDLLTDVSIHLILPLHFLYLNILNIFFVKDH